MPTYLKTVQQKKEIQLERIANARRIKAIEVAAKLLATLSSNTFILAILALSIEEEVEIIITPASIPMITITTSSSINVKDLFFIS